MTGYFWDKEKSAQFVNLRERMEGVGTSIMTMKLVEFEEYCATSAILGQGILKTTWRQ